MAPPGSALWLVPALPMLYSVHVTIKKLVPPLSNHLRNTTSVEQSHLLKLVQER